MTVGAQRDTDRNLAGALRFRQEIMLYIALVAITKATNAKAPTRNAANRGSVTESAISSSIQASRGVRDSKST